MNLMIFKLLIDNSVKMNETTPVQEYRTPKNEIALIAPFTVDIKLDQIEKILGYVSGVSIQGVSLGKGFFAGLKNLTGGRISEYEERHKTTEEQALDELLEEAYNLGANAILDFEMQNNFGVGEMAWTKASGVAVKLKNQIVQPEF
ncbi:heavy metal-binding domain-containing protein [Candidatus Dojkabacteria bacterium]|nr:heavy metal-binding domain-containing protein [Candidatus Dojkabacteria bacterium]